MTDRIVIVGGVACGPKAAARARRCDPNVEIVIVERGPHISYAGCGLPYYLGGSVKGVEHLWTTQFGVERDPDYFRDIKAIDVMLRTEALAVDREARAIRLRNVETGEESLLEYGRLVLATGSQAARPPIEGMNLDRVFNLQVPDDAVRMLALIEADEIDEAVIIGGGSIALEAVESLFAHGIDVTLVEREDHLLPKLLDGDLAAFVEQEIKGNDIDVLTGETVTRVERASNGSGCNVVTQTREINADMVLVAVGVAPNVELARCAGLTIGPTGAIAVNEFLQTSDPSIYAGGDCVENIHRVSGKAVYAPLGSTANKHGRVIGNNLTGEQEAFPGIVGTAILKSMGLNIARTGLTLAETKALGMNAVATLTPSLDIAHYYPGGKPFFVQLVTDETTEKLLGAQIVGRGDVAKRIDVLATTLFWGGSLKDVSDLDLAYAPPYSTAVDPVAHASNQTRNQIAGMAEAMQAAELDRMLASDRDFVLLDVRQPTEVARGRIDDRRAKHVPLTKLRQGGLGFSADEEIVTVCQSGLRGYEACRILQGLDFSNVKFLQGGIKAWDITRVR
jgi:NADPH-dependent 2,4-dienoyl-CoA reductase/sulfur reductase-like enzyme/rhodanese-related sulfurtransferase